MSKKLPKNELCVFQKVPKNACFWACVRINTQILLFLGKSGKARIQCLCGFPDFLIFIITHPQKWSKKYTMFQGNLLEPKKGKTVGSAADMTIEYLIDILTYIFV